MSRTGCSGLGGKLERHLTDKVSENPRTHFTGTPSMGGHRTYPSLGDNRYRAFGPLAAREWSPVPFPPACLVAARRRMRREPNTSHEIFLVTEGKTKGS